MQKTKIALGIAGAAFGFLTSAFVTATLTHQIPAKAQTVNGRAMLSASATGAQAIGAGNTAVFGSDWQAQGPIYSQRAVYYGNGVAHYQDAGIIHIPERPVGSTYHQVVDVYYDSDGNKLETKSHTHLIGYDCQPGLRRDGDLMVKDDGKGNVQFVQLRLGNEPAVGVKPLTNEGRIMALLAISRSPKTPDSQTPESQPMAGEKIDLAAAR